MGIRAKVSAWALVSMVWVGVLGGVGFFFTDHVAGLSFSLVETNAVPMIKVGRVQKTAWEVYLAGILHAGMTDPEEMEKLKARIDTLSARLLEHQKIYQDSGAASKEWVESFAKSWSGFRAVIDQAVAHSNNYAKEDAMQLLVVEGNKAFDQVLTLENNEENRHWEQMAILRDQAADSRANALRWILAITLLFGLTVLGSWFYARTISQSLSSVIENLTTSVTAISTSIDQQKRIVSQQAASVNQTNITMEELGASAKQSAEQASAVAEGTRNTLTLAQQGIARVDETLNSMDGTKKRVEDIAKQILVLSEQTGQIRAITDMVSDFANETKMLAMNAAVEAVRAGEHGKGFSVLAVETRKLADESKRSAGRINDLVAEIQKATNSTVMATEEGSKTVDQGVAITRDTAQTFQGVTDSVESVSRNAQQISLNVRQQSEAVSQVVESMKTLNNGARETNTGIAQVKEGITVLQKAAQTLREMV